ncbi:MAG: tRNA lysidine(34) synthetase TilS [Chloroflexi bacterium]|nr:tRNA lysidine(34) synthetase TilS [Chloroflexota bacterium]
MILEQRCLLSRAQPLVVGFSGGADSTCLLLALLELGYPVFAAHFNHHLRDSAAHDAKRAAELAQAAGAAFWLGEADVGQLAREQALSIEEAARKARYAFLFDCARKAGAQAVAVGHHADDQVETVLMNFLRGAGPDGLAGMAYRVVLPEWDESIPVVRPLLATWRSEIKAFCAGRGVEPVEDPTNQDVIYTRNRVRWDLLPYLEKLNPAAREAIWRTADILQADNADLEAADEAAWKEAAVNSGEALVVLRWTVLAGFSLGRQRRLVRRALKELRPGLKDIDYAAVERAVGFLHQPTRSRTMDLIAGIELRLEGGQLIFYTAESALPVSGLRLPNKEAAYPLPVPGEIALEGGARLISAWSVPGEGSTRPATELEAWFDGDALDLPLLVRARRPGDRMQPFGMGGQSQKLSDLMVNEKIAARLRGRWPLVCAQDQIVWVPGVRRSQWAQVTAKSKRILRLWVETDQSCEASSD